MQVLSSFPKSTPPHFSFCFLYFPSRSFRKKGVGAHFSASWQPFPGVGPALFLKLWHPSAVMDASSAEYFVINVMSHMAMPANNFSQVVLYLVTSYWWRWTKALVSHVVFHPAPVCFSNPFIQFDYLMSRIWISNWLDRSPFHLNLFGAPGRFLFCKIPPLTSCQIFVFMRTILSRSVFPTLTFSLLFPF